MMLSSKIIEKDNIKSGISNEKGILKNQGSSKSIVGNSQALEEVDVKNYAGQQ